MSEIEWGPSKQKQFLKIVKELESEGIVDLEDNFSEVMSDEELSKLCRDVRNEKYSWNKAKIFNRHVLKKDISCRQISRAFCVLSLSGLDQIDAIKSCLGYISDPENYKQISLISNLYKDDRDRLFNAFYEKEELRGTADKKIGLLDNIIVRAVIGIFAVFGLSVIFLLTAFLMIGLVI